MNIKLKKGDKVRVIAGKSKGQEGAITKVLRAKNRVIIEGVNLATKHVKPTQNEEGKIKQIEASIDVSNVALIDPKIKGVTTKIGYEKIDGKKVRIAKKSGSQI